MRRLHTLPPLLLIALLLPSPPAGANGEGHLEREAAGPAPPAVGVHHRLPAARNRLIVVLPDTSRSEALRVLDRHRVRVRDHRLPRVKIAEFSDDRAMLIAQSELRRIPGIDRVGPLIAEEPLAFLTDRIAVRFRDAGSRSRARTLLDRHGLLELRALPYVERGFVFRGNEASFALYEPARELIEQGHAEYAVPILHVVGPGDDSRPELLRSGTTVAFRDYLLEMNVPEAWETIRGRVDDIVVAVLDDGIQGNVAPNPYCDRLRVGVVVDFVEARSCVSDGTDWCETCEEVWHVDGSFNDQWCEAHGNGVALTAAATEAGDDLRGVAPGLRLISARDWRDFPTDEAFADALWWLAGGDLASASPLPRLGPEHRASVITLAFSRDYLLDEDCGEPGCALVCASGSTCGLLEDALARLRHPEPGDGLRERGVVVVNAVGDEENDLARSANTLAVGSVRVDDEVGWSPFDTGVANGCGLEGEFSVVHCFGDFVDVVAPLGSDRAPVTVCEACVECQSGNECPGDCPSAPVALEFGASSGAAAAVSGIVAMMFEAANDKLSADQVFCILGETAQPRNGPGEVWEDVSVWADRFDCSFDGEHSPCFGHGMIDAAAAVNAARHCKSRSRHCPCPELPAPAANDEPPRGRGQPGPRKVPSTRRGRVR